MLRLRRSGFEMMPLISKNLHYLQFTLDKRIARLLHDIRSIGNLILSMLPLKLLSFSRSGSGSNFIDTFKSGLEKRCVQKEVGGGAQFSKNENKCIFGA